MISRCKLSIILILIFSFLVSCTGGDSAKKPAGSESSAADSTTEYTDPAAPADGGIGLENATAGEILDYFAEIAFGSEFGTSAEKLCRWKTKIFYTVTGTPTDSDKALIDELAEKLRGIENFPGIEKADSAEDANFEIMFIPRSEIVEKFGNATQSCVGMSEYNWNTDSCEIISARAAIDVDATSERESTICEEFLQAMGLAKDSYAHMDSVFYQGKCVYKRPSELDWTMVRLLYHPELHPGMSKYEAVKAASVLLAW